MLDMNLFRKNPDLIKQALLSRGYTEKEAKIVDTIADFDQTWRSEKHDLELLLKKRNDLSKRVNQMKKEGQDTSDLVDEVQALKQEIADKEENVGFLEDCIKEKIRSVPNIPHSSTPVGKSESENVVVRKEGEKRTFSFEPKPHEELGEKLGILDFQRAAKVTGSRFTFYKGTGSHLERALSNFMLDVHCRNGYTEFTPPVIVNEASLIGTGQLPKFKDDLFRLKDDEKPYYLIPTAEVPVTNYHRNEILSDEELPLNYTAFSACFRSEAGSAGRDTRGIIRQHQFNKVELVKLVKPEDSYMELEKITRDAERILQLLELPYQVVSLCTGDMGFGSAKTYDLEVWFPSQQRYREISSASNFEDFQARRAQIRFRRSKESKPEFVHTLNASGLAVGRCFAAVLENCQLEDGTILIPKALRPYMGGMEILK